MLSKDNPNMSEHISDALKDPGASTTPRAKQVSKRRRSALACLSCRRRKVRCNVSEQLPCRNCRFDEIQCSVPSARKYLRRHYRGGKRDRHAEAELYKDPLASTHEASDRLYADGIKYGFSQGAESSGTSASDVIFSLLRPWSTVDDLTPIMKSLHTPVQFQADRTSILGCVDVSDNYIGSSSPSSIANPADVSSPGVSLSCLVQPLLSRISPEDALFLSLKGALNIPEGPFCDALLESFINYVYPFLPIIDLTEFLPLIQQHQEEAASGERCLSQTEAPISLLLVQAVMFSASAFVNEHYLQKAGFQSRRVARRSFFERVKFLYNFDCESDVLAISQSLLLMTLWHETVDDEKGPAHWIRLAMNTIELADSRGITSSKPQLWKRIKWACLVRDRSVSLGMRDALTIKPASFKTPPLTISDFEVIITPEVTGLPFAQSTILIDSVAQRELANIFITACQLWAHIGRVLSMEYDAHRQRQPQEGSAASRMVLCPKKGRHLEAIAKFDQELMQFPPSLPEKGSISSRREPIRSNDPRVVVWFYQVLLNLIYQTAIATLHRPNSNMRTDYYFPSTECSTALSKLRVSDACRNISRLLTDLYRLGLDRYLPSSALSVLIPAMLTLALEWKSTISERARDGTIRRVGYCWLVLERLRGTYCGGDHGVQLLQAALGSEFSELQSKTENYLEEKSRLAVKHAASFGML